MQKKGAGERRVLFGGEEGGGGVGEGKEVVVRFLCVPVSEREREREMRSMKWALLLVLVCVTSSALGFKGELMDVTCTAEMINESNRGLRNILNRLVSSSTFFSIFKVNMYKDCPFWPDDGMCTSKESCGVECCGDDDVPVGWRADGRHFLAVN